MIIVSQDKRSIINFKQIAIVNINRSDLREIEAFFDCNEDNKNSILLGKYSTEERAREVLQEIIDKYKEYATISNITGDDIRGIYNIPKVYEMPKE